MMLKYNICEDILFENHFYFNIDNDSFQKECFDIINNEQKNSNIDDCFVHDIYRNLLSCHLGIPPSQSKRNYILILGSAGKIGLAFTKLLKDRNILFVEVRGKLHFDLNLSSIYSIFDHLKIIHVFDLIRDDENELIHEKVYEYFNKKNIIITRVVENQINTKYDQIISPKAYGNQYLRIGVSQIFNDTFQCIVKNSCNNNHIFTNDVYASVNDIVLELLKAIEHKKPQIIKHNFSIFTEKEIWEKIILYKHKQLKETDKLYPIFEDIYIKSIERQKEPYLTIGYSVTNDQFRYEKAENTIKMIEKVLDEYPDINIELIILWIKNKSNLSFKECMNVGLKLKKRLHVYEISHESIQLILKTLRTSYIPEYFFRDIEVRLGNGELLMTGSSDIYPAPLFFEIAQRKLIGPFTILKSLRVDAESFNESFMKYLKKDKPTFTLLDQSKKKTSFWYYYNFSQGALGDFQGALKQTMYKINGWLFDKYVFAADTIFAWDLTTFKVPFYSVSINNSMHQYHKPTSSHSPKFNMKKRPFKIRNMLCKGIPTKNMEGNIRPNWGVSFNFQVNDQPYKYGHLVYDIITVNDDSLIYQLHNLQFKIVYNNISDVI